MGQQHNELRRGSLSAAITRALGDMRGGGVERYGETLTPVLDVWSLPEWALLREEYLWAARIFVDPVVGELSGAALSLPIGSPLICVVEAVTVQTVDTTVQILAGFCDRADVSTTYTIQGAPFVVDQRRAGQSGPLGRAPIEMWMGSNPASIGASDVEAFSVILGLEPTPLISPPWILSGGRAVRIEVQTANQDVRINWRGRVRVALQSELLG